MAIFWTDEADGGCPNKNKDKNEAQWIQISRVNPSTQLVSERIRCNSSRAKRLNKESLELLDGFHYGFVYILGILISFYWLSLAAHKAQL